MKLSTIHYQPLVEATRGRIVESIQYGAIAVVDAQGHLQASVGDVDTITFLRSTAKPFQALPFVERGGDLHFHFTPQELAVICASHSGTDEHVSVVRGIQEKIGVSEQDLLCGVHMPYDEPTAKRLECLGEPSTPNRHNCSGKHTGMLAHARLRGLPIEEYIDPQHPVQRSILAAFAEMCGLPQDQVELGVDGCSAPNFAVSLYHAAWSFARLCDPVGLSPERAQACQRITAAMTSNPMMIAGPGRFDTNLMELASGRILAKGGAEGYQGVGIMPGALAPGSPALGLAFKISDGDLQGRARPLAVLEALRQLGAISKRELDALEEYGPRPIYNWRKIEVGELRPGFELEKVH